MVTIPNKPYEHLPRSPKLLEAFLFNIYLNEEIIGKINLSIEGRQVWIWGFEIYKDYQGNGYSKKALNIIINRCRGIELNNKIYHFTKVILHCYPDNLIANNLYKSYGFKLDNPALGGLGNNIYTLNI